MFINIKFLISLLVLLSMLLISFVVFNYGKPLNDRRIKLIRLEKIQKTCMKSYLKKRKVYTPQRSLIFAQKKINNILKIKPLIFTLNSFELDKNNSHKMKQTLREISTIVNHVNDDVILSIETHTDKIGTNQHNLKLSQKRADVLKDYFLMQTKLPFIVAIGYGEELTPIVENNKTDRRRVEINLKRIQE